MNRRMLVFALALVALIGVLIVASLRTVQTECELCVTFSGRTECRRGSGATEEEAKLAAQRAACAVMAAGMAQSVNCQNVPPTRVQCG